MSGFSFLDSITCSVDNTPLVTIRKLTASRGFKATVLVKVEFFNPAACYLPAPS
jgi:cysteine synthase